MLDIKFLEEVTINNGRLLVENDTYCPIGAVMKAYGHDFSTSTFQSRNETIMKNKKLFDNLNYIQSCLLDSHIPGGHNPIRPYFAKVLMLEMVKEYV